MLHDDVLTSNQDEATDIFLTLCDQFSFEVDPAIEVDDFLKTHDGLDVDPFFNQLTINDAGISNPYSRDVVKYTLKKGISDVGIRKVLSTKFIFDASDLRLIIASQIKKQLNGKDGLFRTDGWPEIFQLLSVSSGLVYSARVVWAEATSSWLVGIGRYDHADYNLNCSIWSYK